MVNMKLQSAVEYLTTYGWALLVIAVIFTAVFALGIFSTQNTTPQQCVAPGGFACTSFAMNTMGVLHLDLFQNTNTPINITGYGCYQSTAYVNIQIPNNPPSNAFYMPVGSQRNFTIPCYTSTNTLFSGTDGTIYSGQVIINYTTVASIKRARRYRRADLAWWL